jgi:hypothetical protein
VPLSETAGAAAFTTQREDRHELSGPAGRCVYSAFNAMTGSPPIHLFETKFCNRATDLEMGIVGENAVTAAATRDRKPSDDSPA